MKKGTQKHKSSSDVVKECLSPRGVNSEGMDYLNLLGPAPAFGRLGLGGSSGECSSHGYTSHALLRAYSAQLGGDRFFEFRESECQRGPSLMEICD